MAHNTSHFIGQNKMSHMVIGKGVVWGPNNHMSRSEKKNHEKWANSTNTYYHIFFWINLLLIKMWKLSFDKYADIKILWFCRFWEKPNSNVCKPMSEYLLFKMSRLGTRVAQQFSSLSLNLSPSFSWINKIFFFKWKSKMSCIHNVISIFFLKIF